MFSLPAFLSFPFTFPSLPSISLPANIQRRFLSYVLKRALGRFVKAGGLDVERIQAQISEGWVEIEGLEVDTDAINSLIPPSIPLNLTSGSLSKVTARVPFPNLWSDPLSITLDQLCLDFNLTASSRKGKSPPSPVASRHVPPLSSPSLDLASSFTSAADEFLHDELDAYEGAELDRSIRQSLVLNQSDPFSPDEVPGAFPFGPSTLKSPYVPDHLPVNAESTTVLAGLVERILARLEFNVDTVRIRIRFEDQTHGGTFELRVKQIAYADESEAGEGIGGRQTVRAVRLSGLGIFLLPLTNDRDPGRAKTLSSYKASNTRSSSTSSASSNTDSGDEYGDMVMSQAVADLRQSMASSIASGASVYQSAISDRFPVGSNTGILSSSDSSRSVTPTGEPTKPPEPEAVMLMTSGSEDIVLRMRTSQSTTSTNGNSQIGKAGTPPTIPNPVRSSTAHLATQLPSLGLELAVGNVACLLLPRHSATIIAALQVINAADTGHTAPSDITSTTTTNNADQPRIDACVKIKGFYLALVYDMDPLSAGAAECIAQFWSKPASAHLPLPLGHLKLRLEGLSAQSVSKGYVSRIGRSSLGAAVPGRSGSVSMASERRAPTITITLQDASIFEYLYVETGHDQGDSEDAPPGGCFPVLIFDANLDRLYDLAPGVISTPSRFGKTFHTGGQSSGPSGRDSTFPEFESADWRSSALQRKPGAGEKAWRTKLKTKGVLKGAVPAETIEGPVLTIQKDLSPDAAATIDALAVHVFLDLSLVERLLPVLRFLAPIVKSTPVTHSPTLSPAALKFTENAPAPIRRDSQYIIDDLDAQASSRSTLRPNARNKEVMVLRCPLVRLDIRCPAPLSRRGSWGDGAHLRSGIFTLNLHGLAASIGQSAPFISGRGLQGPIERSDSNVGTSVSIEWQKMVLFLCRVPEKRSTAFLVIGPLAPESAEDEESGVLLPVVTLKTKLASDHFKTQQITCRIPSVQAKIQQPTIEGLQFFADDMTHWLDGAFGDGSAPKPRDDLKMIGSRFFGSKGSSSSSSAIDDDEDDGGDGGGTVLRVIVSEVELSLHVPRKDAVIGGDTERILSLKASDMEASVEVNVSGRQETTLNISIMDADFSDKSRNSTSKKICGRTTPLTLTTHAQPLFNFRFSSSENPVTDTKESNIKILLTHFVLHITKHWEWIDDLRLFVKTPEGVFEDVVPSEITRIHLQLVDTSVHIKAPTMGGGLVIVLGEVEIKTDLISDSEESIVEFVAGRLGFLAVDDLQIVEAMSVGSASSVELWKKVGFAHLMEVSVLELQIVRDLTGELGILLDVLQAKVEVTVCADSLATAGALAGDLANLSPRKESKLPTSPTRRPSMLRQDIDVFASIDQEAFHQIPDIVSGADMIDDDLPTNLDYLDQTTRPLKGRSTTSEGLRHWEPTGMEEDREFGAEMNGETVRIVMDQTFDLEEDYLENLPVLLDGLEEDGHVSIFRLRLHDCAVNVHLHEGYDWFATRKAIEDEIKVVRRRLERIRQLLASGQKADETLEIEATSSTLFNSVYIGLATDRQPGEKLDTAAMLRAIDDELEDLGGIDTASQSSWQSLPLGERPTTHGAGARNPNRKSLKLRGRKLTRSKRPQIEISLDKVRADYDLNKPSNAVASRIHLTVGRMEILDHIKTSTWKKFLTEMKADSRGNVRETDADMIRVELVAVRPSLPSLEEENRFKAKILPLRLHVDQDALDFLKRFFSFTVPRKLNPEGPFVKKDSSEPFFQHVEVFPIELKLDYKPKRVDFAALREGRTIELMNFFHFDGAEMTLRHITLSGITGWSRLSNTLNDLWTPDVKANQLMEVISGVSPVRSLVNVGSGVADLILLPIEQYRRDGRLAKGMQRGAGSFVRSTGGEMMKLGARLATGTQVLLEGAEGMLGGSEGRTVVVTDGEVSGVIDGPKLSVGGTEGSGFGSGSRSGSRDMENESDEDGSESVVVSRFANQPVDIREGVQAAYKSLSRNINSAAQTILAVPMEVYERSGEDGPLRAVVRAVPIAVLKPMIGGAEAISKTLLGMRNSIDPEGRRELGDKYK